jgi:hypothetical protein
LGLLSASAEEDRRKRLSHVAAISIVSWHGNVVLTAFSAIMGRKAFRKFLSGRGKDMIPFWLGLFSATVIEV